MWCFRLPFTCCHVHESWDAILSRVEPTEVATIHEIDSARLPAAEHKVSTRNQHPTAGSDDFGTESQANHNYASVQLICYLRKYEFDK